MLDKSHLWKIWALIGAVIVALAFFIYFVDFTEVLREIGEANIWYLLAASAALIICLIFYAMRWRLLLNKNPTFTYTFHTSNIGHGVNTVVPLRAGEVARIAIMGADEANDVTYTEAASSYVIERIFEQLMRLVAFGAAVLLGAGSAITGRTLWAVILPLVFAFTALLWLYNYQEYVLKKWPERLAKLPYISRDLAYHSIAGFLRNLNGISSLRRLTAVFFLTGMTWFWGAVYHLLVIASMGDVFPLRDMLTVSLAALAFSPPSATTQPIIFQSLIVAPLTLAGYNQNDVFTYAVLLNASQMFWMLILGLWGLLRLGFTVRGLRQLVGESDEVRELVRERGRTGEWERQAMLAEMEKRLREQEEQKKKP